MILDKSETIAEVGGHINEFSICLAIYGDHLDPEMISNQIGLIATSSHRKGEYRSKPKSGAGKPFKEGAWLLTLRGEVPGTLNDLALKLTSMLSADQENWDQIHQKNDIQIRIALHMEGWNKGCSLPQNALEAFARIHATLEFDIYAYNDEE